MLSLPLKITVSIIRKKIIQTFLVKRLTYVQRNINIKSKRCQIVFNINF